MKQRTMKIVVGITLALLVVGFGVFGYTQLNKAPSTETEQEKPKKKQRISLPVNVIPINERPYLNIVPLAGGKKIVLEVLTLKKPADDAEYELEYQAGSLLQGAFGAITLASIPAKEEILLGSCSAGGACTYHEDVKGGTLLTKFNGPEEYALKSEWRFYETTAQITQVTSKDELFTVSSTSPLNAGTTIVFINSGYPDEVPGEIISEIYTVASSQNRNGNVTVSIQLADTPETEVKLMGWDGTAWKEQESNLEANTIMSTGPLLQSYLLIK